MISPMIYLASQSPRRSELLQQIGISFQKLPVEIDESPAPAESARDYVVRMASEKAHQAYAETGKGPVLAADTTVVCNNRIFGKPRNQDHFQEMMRLLSQNTHQVMTAVTVVDGKQAWSAFSCSDVTFRAITQQEILHYWQTGEPHDKAGGYAIQGHGAIFIQEIRGSYSGIMGLPIYETAELLSYFGVNSL